jgi:RNA polymerase sigma-70 factor (ECF subfamily)
LPRIAGQDCAQLITNSGETTASSGALTKTPLPSQSDHELLAGLRGGSELHFNELYNRYFQRIYSFVYTRLRSHADAEEVVQETFTVVFCSFESFRGTSSLLSWVYGIAKNTLSNRLRRSKIEGQRIAALPMDALRQPVGLQDCDPEEHLRLTRYVEAIRGQFGSIPEWQSEIFFMRHFENLSIKEISTRTARSSDAVRSCLYRVKRLLFETADLPSPRSGTSASAGR